MTKNNDFDELDYMFLDHPLCPSCGEEISDHHNGGDPAIWWSVSNIPEGNFQHKCACGQIFRVSSSWSPTFTVVPIEHDTDYENDYSSLEES